MNAKQLADGMESVGHYNTAAMLRKQAEAIQILRVALDNYLTQDAIASDYGSGVGGSVQEEAKAALAATENI